jgi:hypothetical protein
MADAQGGAGAMDDRGTRTRVMLADPDFMDKFCAHIANGGAGPEYCQERDVRFSDVMAWIGRDADRKSMYAHSETARAQWFVQSILTELKNIGLVDIREAYDANNKLKDLKDIPPAVARCIVAIETDELFEGFGKDREQIGITKRVKFSDKLRALELLGKNLQMFIDTSRVIHMGRVTLEDLVTQSMAGPSGPEAIDITPTKEVERGRETVKEIPEGSAEAEDASRI